MRNCASIQPVGVRVEMPIPLSSHRKINGIGEPWKAAQPAVLNAPCAVEWFAEASPKLVSTTASSGSGSPVMPRRRAMPIEKAAPTALGKCEAIVEVCGGILSGFDPITLCRPPEIGSSDDAAKLSSMSHVGVPPGSWRARWSWKAFER